MISLASCLRRVADLLDYQSESSVQLGRPLKLEYEGVEIVQQSLVEVKNDPSSPSALSPSYHIVETKMGRGHPSKLV